MFTAPVLDVDENRLKNYNLNHYISLFQDKKGTLTIDDVISDKVEFTTNQSSYPGFGFTRSAIWGKFTWTGTGDEPHWKLLFDYPMLDNIDLFIVNSSGKLIQHIKGGSNIPFGQKPVANRKHAFTLDSPGTRTWTVYFKVTSEDTLEIPLRLMSDDCFNKNDSRNSFLIGIYYGIILVMFIYNFFIFVTIKDSAYLNYVIYLFSYGIVQLSMDGLLNEYVFSSSNYLAKTSRMFFANIAIIFALKFANNFFRFGKNFPRFNRILQAIYIIAILNSILVFFNFMSGAVLVFVLLFIAVLIFLFFSIRLYNDYPPVRLYFFGWIVYIACTFLWVLKLAGIYIPGITPYAMQFGSATEVTLLSFALGARINLIRQEKEMMKRTAVRQRKLAVRGKIQLEALRSRTRGIEKDLSMARDIQMGMIPLNSPVDYIKSIYLPMEKVGGDFFNIIPLLNGRWGILISDVSGHGVPAALITVMIRSLIVTGVNNLETEKENSWLEDPSKFILHMNNSLYGHLNGNFISAFYGIYDPGDNSLFYRGASHPPPIILKKPGGSEKTDLSFLNLSPQLPPIGVKVFKSESDKTGGKKVILEKGSRLFMYSDGLMDNVHYDYENMLSGMESFKPNVLYDVFDNCWNMDLKEFMASISSELLLYRLNSSLEDDVCVVTLEV